MEVYEIISIIYEIMVKIFDSIINTETGNHIKSLLINPKISDNILTLASDEAPQAVESVGGTFINLIVSFLPIIVIVCVMLYCLSMTNPSDGYTGSYDSAISNNDTGFFSSNKVKPEQITFADVAGIDEAKEEVKIYVDILKNRDKYLKAGAKLPKGFMMVGPPGCGKTLLAKAIAGESGCSFIAANGSEFDEMYVGVGASRVRNLFKTARSKAPCIIFIDEIDGAGQKRGGFSNHEADKTLNAILTEMDGFKATDNVLVIAATNRVDTLDEALTRSGRFDQQVVIDPPSVDGRVDLFKLYMKKLNLDPKSNLEKDAKEIAKMTPGVNGADISNICNQAAIMSVNKGENTVTLQHLIDSIENVLIGGQRKSRKVSEEEKRIVAYHECGHAILGYLLKCTGSPLTISIIPRGAGNLGYTMPDIDDKMLKSKQELIEEIAALMGGRIAEEIFCSDITGGASNDIEKATNIAYAMCTQFGMSKKLGKVQLSIQKGNRMTGGPKASSQTMGEVDEIVRKLIDDIYNRSKDMMLRHKDDVERLTKYLLEKEVLKKEDANRILGKDIHNIYEINDIEF